MSNKNIPIPFAIKLYTLKDDLELNTMVRNQIYSILFHNFTESKRTRSFSMYDQQMEEFTAEVD